MDLKVLFQDGDRRAVSPVIGVILMVAITVILAAVIGAFVIGIGEDQEVTPTASFDFDFDSDSVTVTHSTGDAIEEPEKLDVVIDGTVNEWVPASTGTTDRVSAGSQRTLDTSNSIGVNTSGEWSEESINVVWTSETGDSSATLSSTTAPDTSP